MLKSTHLNRWQRGYQYIIVAITTLLTGPVWANLPTPPAYEYSKNGDWLTVAENVGDKATNIFLIFMAVALLGGVFSGILRGYQSAQERQEMSHFFKAVGVGLICLALGFGLLYGAHLVVGSQRL